MNYATRLIRIRHRQRGSIYVLVLGVSLIVATIGIAGMLASRVYLRQVSDVKQMGQARVIAISALDLAMYQIATDTNWRTTHTHDTWIADSSLGEGKYSYKIVDETDGDLSNDFSDAIRIYGRGTTDTATRIYSIRMQSTGGAPTDMLREAGSFRREVLP